jgi:alkylation response protein AidB-like acyl-CoA dehydrogenase
VEFELSETQVAARDAVAAALSVIGSGESAPPWRTTWTRLVGAGLVELVAADPKLSGATGIEVCEVLRGLGLTALHVPLLGAVALAPALVHDSPARVRDRWLPRVRSGEAIITPAVGEVAVSTAEETKIQAVAAGNGWELTGNVIAVPFAAEADRLLMWAATTDADLGVYLVDPHARGVTLTSTISTTGETEYAARLDGVAIDADDIVAVPGHGGARAAKRVYQHLLVGLAAEQTGLAQASLEMTARYMSTREQFGQPIGAFQAVHTRAADAYIDLEAMRWTMYHAAERVYEGFDAPAEVAVAKFWAADGGARVLAAAIHLHGGIGVDTTYPLHRYFLRAKRVEFMLGGAGTQLALLWDALSGQEALVD